MITPENLGQAIAGFRANADCQPDYCTRRILLHEKGPEQTSSPKSVVIQATLGESKIFLRVAHSFEDEEVMWSFRITAEFDTKGYFTGLEDNSFPAWAKLKGETFLLSYVQSTDDPSRAVLGQIKLSNRKGSSSSAVSLELEKEVEIREQLITAGCPEVVLTEATALHYLNPELAAGDISPWLLVTPETPT